jgi:arylsulfatase A
VRRARLAAERAPDGPALGNNLVGRPIPVIFRMLCLFVCLLSLMTAVAAADRPNIVLILADDVGREVLGCYGGESYETPQIDALARGGRRFQHCYSMPVCHPTRICLLTGRYPAALGNPGWGSFPAEQEGHTLASMLHQAGYATAIAGKWQLGLLKEDPHQPARLGFDEWSLFGWHEGPRYHDPLIYQNGRLRTDTGGKYGPDLYVDFLIDFLDRHRGQPLFAFYSMALCHDVTDDIGRPVPYGPDGRWLSYAEMVADMDRQVGRLVAALDRMQLREETLILLTTDNGTPAASYLKFEDGKFVRPRVASQWHGQLVPGGKGQLTDWGTRVPLIASWPGHIDRGTTCDDLVDFSDFLPTLAELAGASAPEDVPLSGHSFATSLTGRGQTARQWSYAEGRSQRCFVRTQRYKLYSSGEFFDMCQDPGEEHPLAENQLTEQQGGVHAMLRRAIESLPARN